MTTEDTSFTFGTDLQKKILSMLFFNVEFLIQGTKFLKPHYFRPESLAWLFSTVSEYFDKYRAPPTLDVLVEKLKVLPLDERREYFEVVKDVFEMKITDDNYLKDILQDFIKRNIFRSLQLINLLQILVTLVL